MRFVALYHHRQRLVRCCQQMTDFLPQLAVIPFVFVSMPFLFLLR